MITIEGLIGFKLQGFVNDPRRSQDLEDIRALLRANRDTVKLAEVHENFRLINGPPPFSGPDHRQDPVPADTGDPFSRVDDLMAVVEALCPQWPARSTFQNAGSFRL